MQNTSLFARYWAYGETEITAAFLTDARGTLLARRSSGAIAPGFADGAAQATS
jgi:hypothetical protein